MVQDRPRDQVREVGDEERVVHEVVLAHLALGRVDQIGDLGKRVERDAERQDDLADRPVGAEGVVEIVDEEVGVLEIAQQQQIERDAEHEQALRPPRLPRPQEALDPGADVEVDEDREREQQDVLRAPPAVEEERSEREPRGGGPVALPREREEDEERDREEPQDEGVGVEQHRGPGRSADQAGRDREPRPRSKAAKYEGSAGG